MPDEQPVVTPDEPVAALPEPSVPAPTTPDEPVQPEQQPETQPQTPTEPAAPAQPETTVDETDEFEYAQYNVPQAQPIDFSNLPVGEDNLIDPNALAGSINQAVAAAEERAAARAAQAYQEQRAEERSWEKAYEKFPELKSNKELRDLVHNARLGEVSTALSRARTQQEAQSVKLPTPGQMADRLFKHLGTAKAEGMKQATENTVIQQSARLETAGTKGSDSSDVKAKAFQNINNPNKEVAKQARQDLLKSMLFGNS